MIHLHSVQNRRTTNRACIPYGPPNVRLIRRRRLPQGVRDAGVALIERKLEPALPFLAGGPLPARVNEGDFAGAYLGEPIDVVACKTVDLMVPASAEIVVEGLVSPTEKAAEGPMAEYPGYQFPGANTPKPLITITAITHRHNPILPVVAAGPPVEENHTAWGIPHAAQTLHDLREHDLPVSGVWLPFDSANQRTVVASTLARWARWRRAMCHSTPRKQLHSEFRRVGPARMSWRSFSFRAEA